MSTPSPFWFITTIYFCSSTWFLSVIYKDAKPNFVEETKLELWNLFNCSIPKLRSCIPFSTKDIIEFTNENPYGSVVGVRRVYTEGETETIAKTMGPVVDGDTIDFVCDYYSYDGEYLDSYMLGEQMIVDGELMISDVYVDAEAANLTYLFTDIYNQEYWTTPTP